MPRCVLCSLLAFAITAAPACACSPDPSHVYDDIGSKAVSIATATVAAVAVEGDAAGACWDLAYTDAEYLYGIGETDFSVITCARDVPHLEALAEEPEGLASLGFLPDARVLIGVVREDDHPAALRYAIPTCWGPLHVNLSMMPEDQRDGLLQDIRDQIAREQ